MAIAADKLSNPAVRSLVVAINANDREAFRNALTPGATMSDDGTTRNLDEWADREIFSSRGHMDVETQGNDGLSLVASYRNDMWGEMRTAWSFTVDQGKVSHFDTGQA